MITKSVPSKSSITTDEIPISSTVSELGVIRISPFEFLI